MKIYILIFIVLAHSQSILSSTLFDTKFYEIEFISNNVDNTKLKKIKEIKYLSIKKIFKNILNQSDYSNIKKYIDEDLINSLIKNVIFENEKIIQNSYYSKIKINFSKKKIITFLRNNNLQYIEFLPKNFLTIIYNNSVIEKNLFSKHNSYYNYLLSNNYNFYHLPNLDLNDRYILNYSDIEEKNLNKIINFASKYKNSEIILIVIKKNKKMIVYNSYLITNNQIYKIPDYIQNKIDYHKFFIYLRDKVIDTWKLNNGIQNEFSNSLICSIQYYNLLELKEIMKKINNILTIKTNKLLNFSYQEKNYNISYYGNKKILFELFEINNLEITEHNNICKISLI